MKKMSIRMATVAVLCLPACAYAETKTIVLDGLKADVVVKTRDDSRSLAKDDTGPSKKDIIDMVSKATPSVVMVPPLAGGPDLPVR